ncbi:MAG TPA: hypothetical protein VK835_11465 [Bacteroidia bacterium]|jgi:hypothetical protein|nr:hypothetical protein [Bacteroidia bacterium]
MKKPYYIFLITITLSLIGFSSCQQGVFASDKNDSANSSFAPLELNPSEYVVWCQNEENKLKKQKEIQDIVFTLQYKPAEYVLCMEQKSQTISTTVLQKEIKELKGLDYYDFTIGLASGQGELLKYNISSVNEYTQRLNYFAFNMQQNLKLLDGDDTLNCTLFHFERAYDVAPYSVFLLGFPKTKNANSSKTFLYPDKIFGKGMIKFTYTKEDLSQIPKLKTI